MDFQKAGAYPEASFHAGPKASGGGILRNHSSRSCPGISNEATRALTSRAGLLIEQLLPLFRAELHPHVRKNLFKLLTSQPFWTRGIFLFEALRDRDEHIVESGRRALRDWLMRSRNMATAPNRYELQQLATR